MKFTVGQRVRVAGNSIFNGDEGLVIRVIPETLECLNYLIKHGEEKWETWFSEEELEVFE